MQLLHYIYLHFPINKNSTIHVGKTYHNLDGMGFVTYLGPPIFFVKNGWLVGPQRVLPGVFFPIGVDTAEVSFAGKFECWRLAAVMSKYMIDMMILRGSSWWFLLWSDFCYAVMMSFLFIIHKKNQKIYLLECAMALASSCPAFGTSLDLETSLDFVSAAKKEKTMEKAARPQRGCETVSIRDALKPHPETILPLKRQLPPWTGWTNAVKKKREGLAQVSGAWNRFV